MLIHDTEHLQFLFLRPCLCVIIRFASCEGNLAFLAATHPFSCFVHLWWGKTENFLGECWEQTRVQRAGELFKSCTYQRDAVVPSHQGDKSRPETLMYWLCGGSWWPQLLLDIFLMSGSTAAMQVFIFCYENYAKRTGADAIKDTTALERSHQMLSCSVMHAASAPNSSFSKAEHSWFRMNFVLTFLLAQQSEQPVQFNRSWALRVLIAFIGFSNCSWNSEIIISLYPTCGDFLSALCSQTQLPSKLDVVHRMPGSFCGEPEASCSIIVWNVVSDGWKHHSATAPPSTLQYNS